MVLKAMRVRDSSSPNTASVAFYFPLLLGNNTLNMSASMEAEVGTITTKQWVQNLQFYPCDRQQQKKKKKKKFTLSKSKISPSLPQVSSFSTKALTVLENNRTQEKSRETIEEQAFLFIFKNSFTGTPLPGSLCYREVYIPPVEGDLYLYVIASDSHYMKIVCSFKNTDLN